MAEANTKKIVDEFNEALGKSIVEYRPLSAREKFIIDRTLDSMFRVDKDAYYALYSAYTSSIGDLIGLRECVDHFFNDKKKVSLNRHSYRCLLSMSNAAMLEDLYILLGQIDNIPEDYHELFRVYFNTVVTLLDSHKAKDILDKLPLHKFSDEDVQWFNAMVSNVSLFIGNFGEEDIIDLRSYIIEILKQHRRKVIKPIYEKCGPSILMPIFYPDDNKGLMNIIIEYVSDDIDASIDLEDAFYNALFSTGKFPKNAMNSVVYNLSPVNVNDIGVISDRIVDVEF